MYAWSRQHAKIQLDDQTLNVGSRGGASVSESADPLGYSHMTVSRAHRE